MNLDVKDWLTITQLLVLASSVAINVVLFIAARRDSRWKNMDDRLETEKVTAAGALLRMQGTITDFDRRLTVLATQFKSMPTHTDLKELHGQLARIDERSEATQKGVTRIEKFLLERSK